MTFTGSTSSADAPLTVRVGCKLGISAAAPASVLLDIRPEGAQGTVLREDKFTTSVELVPEKVGRADSIDLLRLNLPAGLTEVSHDAIFEVPCRLDHAGVVGLHAFCPNELPGTIIDFVRPSRFCESDRLGDFAWSTFGHLSPGWEQISAVSAWVHQHLEYRFGEGRSDLTAYDVFEQKFGVCRDFAHLTIALCRALNVPARYVSGHLPDIGYEDPGSPMDFHAYAEVYLGGQWVPVDARYNVSRYGRVRVCHGRDAGDSAFLTSFGSIVLTSFEVWAYQIETGTGSVNEPVDLSKRLDGQTQIFHRLADKLAFFAQDQTSRDAAPDESAQQASPMAAMPNQTFRSRENQPGNRNINTGSVPTKAVAMG